MNNHPSSPPQPRDIISYLSSFKDGTLISLYKDEFTVMTVFRSLRGLAKQYVMNLVLCSSAIPIHIISQWALASASANHKAAMYKLSSLKIIESVNSNCIKLNDSFRECLKNVIFGASSRDIQFVENEQKVTPQRITKRAKARWETILNVLVGIGDEKHLGNNKIVGAITDLLEKVELIEKNQITRRYKLKAEGFKFLFADIHSQIWQIVIAYLKRAKNLKLDEKRVLKFLFRLSFLKTNRAYSSQNFGDYEKGIIRDLAGLGLLYQRTESSIYFYPTMLAKHLSSGRSLTKKERDERGFIVVETTFKIYAYTSSTLQIALLSKFVCLDYILPNLITGKITKESIMSAVTKGIPVHLIIDYLQQYAHKKMRNKQPMLPINVCDQMRLWEAENLRMKMSDAFMICLIPTDKEFDEFIKIVSAQNVDQRATMLATNGAPDQIQAIILKIDECILKKQSLNELIGNALPPLIHSLISQMKNNQIRCRYLMILSKFGWNDEGRAFNKDLNANDLMKLSDELCAIHLNEKHMMESASKLLWSNKAEKTMVVTEEGKQILRRHWSQKKANSATPLPPVPPKN